MELDQDQEVLRALAEGKAMDYEQWPSMLPRLISRLEKVRPPLRHRCSPNLEVQIIHEDFSNAKTTSPALSPPSSPSQPAPTQQDAPPAATSTALPAPLLALHKSILDALSTLFATHPPHTIQRLAELLLAPTQHYRSLPAYLHALDRVVHVTSGAHTFPLPPAIPDPTSLTLLANGSVKPGTDPLGVSWGNPAATVAPALGSDESLGGALLTPITWLSSGGSGPGTPSPLEGEVKTESTEIVEGPNGPGGIETVSVSVNGVSSTTKAAPHPGPGAGAAGAPESEIAALRAEGGITQGELLRQEQEAGVVAAAPLSSKAGVDGLGEEDELPHARGPEEIGMDDTGPQAPTQSMGDKGIMGIDVEAAVGRKLKAASLSARAKGGRNGDEDLADRHPGIPKREAHDVGGGEEKKAKKKAATGAGTETETETGSDGDMDFVIVDADGTTADEAKDGEPGEKRGADVAGGTTG
ncbi:hypothetical protein JHW43_009002 [Diplocarpon mali]|nr:hypothetical protein JHW43_009002 [Diplocarpon mali]